jgi:uncharacterized protein involved in exopolysaccharide biosynthesis
LQPDDGKWKLVSSSEKGQLDIRIAIKLLWRKRKLVMGTTCVFTLISIVIAIFTTPAYLASTVLVPASAGRGGLAGLSSALGQFGGIASLAGISLGSEDSEVAESLAVLGSRQFLASYITSRNLLPDLFPDSWDAVSKTWKVPEEKRPTLGDACRYFAGHLLTVTQDKKTGLVTVSIEWRDRAKAAEWVNGLVEKLNSEMRDRARKKADASVAYLKEELNTTGDVGTRDAVNRLIETQVQQKMLANVTEEYSFRVVDRAAIPDLKERIRPKRVLWVLIGTLAGFLLSTSTIVLMHDFNEA